MANKKILVVVDPTAADHPCVDRAAWLAESVSADVELFICDYDPSLAITPWVWFKKGTPVMLVTLVVATIVFVVFFDYFTTPIPR